LFVVGWVGERWGARQRDSRGEIEAAWRGGVADFFRFTATPIRQDIEIDGIWLLIHETQQGNMATPQAVRRWIMTGSVAAVTITGSIYGATLNDDLGVKKVCHLHACMILEVALMLVISWFLSLQLLIKLCSLLTFTPQEKKRVLEATPEERIAQLETARQGLVAQKHEMELKISRFHERKKIQNKGQTEPK
jgi:hypothetical protein